MKLVHEENAISDLVNLVKGTTDMDLLAEMYSLYISTERVKIISPDNGDSRVYSEGVVYEEKTN